MVHAVKIFPEYYNDLTAGSKNFEIRKNDRPYAVGDILAVNEFIPVERLDNETDFLAPFRKLAALFDNSTQRKVEGGCYTGACILFEITYILNDPQFCKDGMVILGLKEVLKCEENTETE